MAIDDYSNEAARTIAVNARRSKYDVHSPEEFSLDMLKGLFANGYIVYTDAAIESVRRQRVTTIQVKRQQEGNLVLLTPSSDYLPMRISGPLEEILSSVGFKETSCLPHVLNLGHSIYFVARYKEEGGEKVPDAYIKFFDVYEADVEIMPPGMKTRLNFVGRDTDAVYDVVDALLGKGYKVAVPSSEFNLDKFFTLVPMLDDAVHLEFD